MSIVDMLPLDTDRLPIAWRLPSSCSMTMLLTCPRPTNTLPISSSLPNFRNQMWMP